MEEKVEGFEQAWKKMFEAEAKFAKNLFKAAGGKKKNFHILDRDKYKEMLKKYGQEAAGETSEGFFIRGTKGKPSQIFINKDLAMVSRSLGTGLHELTHYILKDALKEKYTDRHGV